MTDADDLYRQTKLAQARAERHGCVGTAVALAGIAAMIAMEHGVDAAVLQELANLAEVQPTITTYVKL